VNIKVLGAHNCESQNTKYTCLLIDNILTIDAGGLSSNLSFLAQQKLEAILLTHQHYDHIKDIPAIAMNLYLSGATINIYSTSPTYDTLKTHLLDGKLYPNFLERPQENPTIKVTIIEPGKNIQIEDYSILAVPVTHSAPAVGYQVTSPDGKTIFYTGDTGPGLTECWEYVSPQLLIIEVTASNSYEEFAKESGHLTPSLLKHELATFQKIKGYLPQVVLVHMSPNLEEEIKTEIEAVARALNTTITLGYEGMQLRL